MFSAEMAVDVGGEEEHVVVIKKLMLVFVLVTCSVLS